MTGLLQEQSLLCRVLAKSNSGGFIETRHKERVTVRFGKSEREREREREGE